MTDAAHDDVLGMSVFDNHQALIRSSAISDAVARERGYVSVDQKKRLERLGFESYQRNVPGLLIPLHGVDGELVGHQYRPDKPRLHNGKPVKYETPAGWRMRLDVHPRARAALGDPSVSLMITEGIRKADAAVSAGHCCIGLLGVWNWRGTNESGGKTALADWHDVALNGRQVRLAFDSDAATNRGVAQALAELARFLEAKGAIVTALQIPAEGDDKVGLDDWLAGGRGIEDLAEAPLAPAAQEEDPRDLLRVAVLARRDRQLVDGAAFVLDEPEMRPAIWGKGSEVLWASGESLLVNGPIGVGKTTIAQQVALARLGLRPEVLGWPVEPDDRAVLYIAADRPPQAARSLKRMVDEQCREMLGSRLKVWKGPLPHDLAKQPELLVTLAEMLGVGTVFLDSIKDVVSNPADPDQGQGFNQAVQLALLEGFEVVALHHQRKAQQGGGKPKSIDDVYGSTWIPAGAGSVLLIWGQAGDAIVELSHLKPPVEAVGPVMVNHDHEAGVSSVDAGLDVLGMIRSNPGVTAVTVARALFSNDKPSANEVEKARRKLKRLVSADLAVERTGSKPGAGGKAEQGYHPVIGDER